jgi:hypothetical protein
VVVVANRFSPSSSSSTKAAWGLHQRHCDCSNTKKKPVARRAALPDGRSVHRTGWPRRDSGGHPACRLRQWGAHWLCRGRARETVLDGRCVAPGGCCRTRPLSTSVTIAGRLRVSMDLGRRRDLFVFCFFAPFLFAFFLLPLLTGGVQFEVRGAEPRVVLCVHLGPCSFEATRVLTKEVTRSSRSGRLFFLQSSGHCHGLCLGAREGGGHGGGRQRWCSGRECRNRSQQIPFA